MENAVPTPPSTETPASPTPPLVAPGPGPDFKPVSIQHLGPFQVCDCCYYNSSTDGCS